MTTTGVPLTRRALTSPDDLVEVLGIGFSDEQLEAITAPLEPAVVIAGAGSGKTTVMAARVVWLVGSGLVRPDEVLGLTFTRKAASELASRVRTALIRAGVQGEGPDDEGEEQVMTYDSFAARLVGEQGIRIGLESDPRMLTGASRYRLGSRVVVNAPGPFQSLSRLRPASVTERVLKLDADMASHLVSRSDIEEHWAGWSARLADAPRTARGAVYASVRDAHVSGQERLELLDLVDRYRRLKRSLGLVEFADQMSMAAELVRRVPSVGVALREQYRVVLLDEYQDTSSAQAQLLRGLFSGTTRDGGLGHAVTAVGDPFQAIYGWRGAAASNILQFAEHFRSSDGRPARAYTLRVNRRSGQLILDVANRVADGLRSDPQLGGGQAETRLVAPADSPGGEVDSRYFDTWADEVDWIADEVVVAHDTVLDGRDAPTAWGQIAVLARRNADIAPIYAALTERNVPAEIVGLGGLLELPEVADVVATLTLLNDVTANPSLIVLLQGPRWRIGPRDLALLGRRAAELSGRRRRDDHEPDLHSDLMAAVAEVDVSDAICLLDAVEDLGETPLSAEARERLERFRVELVGLRRHSDEPVLDLARRIVATLGLEVELRSTRELVQHGRANQLARFLDGIADYSDVDGDASLSGLLAYLDAELAHGVGLEQAVPTDRDSVKLLTVHRAKGLEWDVVFLPSLTEGVFPSDRVTDNWIRNPAALPSALRGDRDAIPQPRVGDKEFKTYSDDLAAEQRRSEDRLAYVGITRARKRIIGTAHSWRPLWKKSRTPSSYAQELFGGAEAQGRAFAEPVSETNPEQAVDAGTPWPLEPDRASFERRLAAVSLVTEAREGLRGVHGLDALPAATEADVVAGWDRDLALFLAEAADRGRPAAVQLPASLSASALMAAAHDREAFDRDLVRPMPRQISQGASLGQRFHEWVEARFAPQVSLDLEPIGPGAHVPDEALARLILAFEAGEFAERTPYAVEEPFVLVLGDIVVRGRVDAIYAASGEFDFLVVDWKTSRQPSDPLQLAIYRTAWAEAMGVQPERVDAAFVHLASGVVERPRDLPGRAQLMDLVARG